MFQFGKYNLDIIEMLSGHQPHQYKGLGLERQLQHQQQVQLQHQLQQQQQQQQAESSGSLLSGLGLGPLQGSRSSSFSDSSSIFAKMSAPPPPLQQQSLSSSSQSSRKSSKMSGSSSSGYPQFLRSFHPSDAALAQEQLHPGVGRFEHFGGSSSSSGSLGGLVSSGPPPPPPLHPGLSVPQASPGPSSSSPSPSSSGAANNPPSSSAVTSLGHQLVGAQSDARSLHQQFSCMLAANQYFLSGVPANASLEQFLVQQGSHNHLGLPSDSSSSLAPPPALHSSHSHSNPPPQQQPPQQQQLPPHTLSHPHSHPHHPLHSSSHSSSSLGSFDFQGIPVLSSNQLASLMQQEAGLPLPLPLHLSLSKDDGKGGGDGHGGSGSSGSRRKKAMAGYMPQRKSDGSSNNNNSGSTSHSSSNPNSSSTSSGGGGHSQSSSSGLMGGGGGGGGLGMSSHGGQPPSLLSSSSVVSSSSSAAPSSSSAAASVLVTNGSHLSKANSHRSMGPPSSQPEAEALYNCTECGKNFTHLSSLRRHLRCHELTTAGSAANRKNNPNPIQHPGERPVGQSTSQPSSSAPATSAPATSSCPDSPDKMFHCSECGKGFKKKGHLIQHGVIHSGAKPFACSMCSRAFNRRESLTRHEKIHEEKPFRCPACGRCFRESTSLLNHAASGTCGKPGRPARTRSPGGTVIPGKRSKSGTAGGQGGMGNSGVGSYRGDGYNDDYKGQRSHPYSGSSSCGSGMGSGGQTLRKAPLAPTLHPHPQSQHHHQQQHLPLSSLLDDSEDDVTSSVNNAISAITADMNSSGNRGDDRRDIIGGLLGGLGLGPMGGGPSSTSGMDKSYRGGGGGQGNMGGGMGPNQKPKRPRKPRKKKEPGPGGVVVKRRQPRGPPGERPYLCSICGKGFARRETLRRHDRVHSGEKPHHCTVCGKYFREAFHLSKHQTVHTGEKNYKCGLCSKEFGYSQSLKRHSKTHQKGEVEEVPTTPGGENLNNYPSSGGSSQDRGQGSSSSYYSYSQDVKPQGSGRLYTCAICWKSFRHHFHLTAHHQTVHEQGGEKLFSCEVCGKAFAYSNSLTRHRLSQHGLTRQSNSQGDASGSGTGNNASSSVNESEAATNALLQLAPPGGSHGEQQQSHGGVLSHGHQQPPPQPQAGYSPLFYVPDTNTSHPSSSNNSPYSNIPPLSHQQSPTGVKGEPHYQSGTGHSMNTNPSHSSYGLSPNEAHHLHHHQHHSDDLYSHHHHHGYHSQDDLRKKKKKKKKKDFRLSQGGYRWDGRMGAGPMGMERDPKMRMLLIRRRAMRRRQRRFRKRMALLLRIRKGGSGKMCELATAQGMKVPGISSVQNPLKRFPCPLCPRAIFSRRAALLVHHAAKHCPKASFPKERLKCTVCGKKSRKFWSAFVHRASHLSKGTFSCKRCSSRFWNATLLARHKSSCRGKLAGLRRGGRGLNSKIDLDPPVVIIDDGAEEEEGQEAQQPYTCDV